MYIYTRRWYIFFDYGPAGPLETCRFHFVIISVVVRVFPVSIVLAGDTTKTNHCGTQYYKHIIIIIFDCILILYAHVVAPIPTDLRKFYNKTFRTSGSSGPISRDSSNRVAGNTSELSLRFIIFYLCCGMRTDPQWTSIFDVFVYIKA